MAEARLAGKVAFVTGAGGSIGGAICQRLLKEGARVVGADIKLAATVGNLGSAVTEGRALALECDVTESEGVRDGIDRTVREFGGLQILCNVAGGSTSADNSVTEAPEEEFWRAIKLDLFATFLVCKHGLPHLIVAGGGSVINMASMVALMPVPRRSCYTAAKGGIVSLTRAMAAEYAEHRVRVNAVAPGIIASQRLLDFMESDPQVRQMATRHLLGIGQPADVAEMAVFLASDEARIVTGQIISVDSGVTLS